ncbi:MAG: winged helix-turn-helix domain-containing protein [Woeseiaceae bacterium]
MNSPDTGRERYRVGGLTIDVGTRSVMRAGQYVSLPKRSFELLLALVRSAPNVLETDELIEQVWHGAVVSPETITQRIKLLRQAIGDDAHNPNYVGLVRGQGYRLIADVDLLEHETPTVAPANKRTLVWGTIAAVSVILGWLFLGEQDRDDSTVDIVEPPAKSIAILPLTNFGGPDDEVFSRGIPDTILHKLVNIDELIVIARTSSFAYADSELSASEIGRNLGVRYLLEGSVLHAGNTLRISARLVDTSDASYAWSIERELPINDVLEVENQIVLEIVDALKLTLHSESRARILAHGTENVPAYLAYQRGVSAIEGQSLAGAHEAELHFHEALELDPEYARAWVGLARVNNLLKVYGELDVENGAQQIYDYATKALEYDPGLGEAYLQIARRYLSPLTMTTDADHLSEVRQMIQKAAELSPGHPSIMRMQAAVTCASSSRNLECIATKKRLLREALRRDPESSQLYTSLAGTLIELGEMNAAIETLHEALRRSPEFPYGNWMLAWISWEIGEPDWPKAAACLAKGANADPSNMTMRASIAALNMDAGLTQRANGLMQSISNKHGSYDSWLLYLEFINHLRNGETNKARPLTWQIAPDIAAYTGQSELVYSVLVDDALATGQVDIAKTLLDSRIEFSNRLFAQYEDGLIKGRSSAYAAIALARLYLATGEYENANALVAGSLELFEREIAGNSPWVGPNTNAYALSLLLSGERDQALQELSKLPDTYLRRAWFLAENPAFESLREEPAFRDTVARIDAHIGEFRDVMGSDAADSINCLPGI